MCDKICFTKMREKVKKIELQQMLDSGVTDMLDEKLDVQKIKDFLKNGDCCKGCEYNTQKENSNQPAKVDLTKTLKERKEKEILQNLLNLKK
jgi:hypothetical protein